LGVLPLALEGELPPPLFRSRRRSERLLERGFPPPLPWPDRLLERWAGGAEDPSLAPEETELEEPPEWSLWDAVKACPASALESCWKLSSSMMRKERALWKVCGGNLKVITGLT